MISERNKRRMAKKQALKDWKKRECGECTACCTVLGVTELEKQAYVPCQHACNGCQIYKDRPTTCRTYSCGWKLGILPPEFYPPEVGVVIDTTNPLGATTVREVVPGASQQLKAKAMIGMFAKRTVTVVVRGEHDRTILGPPGMVERFMKQAEKLTNQQGWAPG